MNRLVDKFLIAAVVLSASATALVASPGFAQTDVATVVVRFNDLKMDDPAAAAVLERRIERAAAEVCGGQPDVRELSRWAVFSKCRTEASNRAVSQLRVAGVLSPAHGAGISPLARR